MKRVLVGVDGSETAERCLSWASTLAAGCDAEVVLASVVGPPPAEVDRYTHERELRTVARSLTDRWSEPARRAGVGFTTAVLEGDARRSLLDLADSEDIDLLVVGRDRGGLLGHRIGSVSEHLAQHTDRPLAVVPPSAHEGPVRTVIVAIDGSEGSAAATRWCADVAGSLGAEVVAVHVDEHPLEWLPRTDPASWHRQAERHLTDEWTAPLRDAGIRIATRVVQGLRPAAAIINEADARRAGLVVVGARGVGGFPGLRIGGTALKVLHHLDRPLALIPSD